MRNRLARPAASGSLRPCALAEAGLIDEYEFIVRPRAAGHGPTLLDGLRQHLDLQFVDQEPVGSAVAMRYEPKR